MNRKYRVQTLLTFDKPTQSNQKYRLVRDQGSFKSFESRSRVRKILNL